MMESFLWVTVEILSNIALFSGPWALLCASNKRSVLSLEIVTGGMAMFQTLGNWSSGEK